MISAPIIINLMTKNFSIISAFHKRELEICGNSGKNVDKTKSSKTNKIKSIAKLMCGGKVF